MHTLNAEEKEIAVNLFTTGYEKAAASFAQMTKERIWIRPASIEISKDEKLVVQDLKRDDELIMITTNIIGEYGGKSYLLFNEGEADAVYRACMSFNLNNASRAVETEALLKELDNILSAAVITEFSNYLNAMIFGDVPFLSRINQNALQSYILDDFRRITARSEFFILADTHFIFENNTELCPQFIWKLTDGFIQGIKKSIKASKKVI